MSPFLCLRQLLESRLDRAAIKWFKEASAEIGDQVSGARFCALLSRASRAVKRRPLELTPKDRAQVAKVIDGWNPEYWNLLEAVRAALVLSRPDLALEGGGLAIEEAFKYGDEGELCALYRSIIILPDPERFVWRVGEGCRSNMRTLFEAAALDTPYPARFFDELTWNQLVMKGIFIGAPMWRLWGLDGRQSPELARMALDLAEERRSAGRAVQHELWLCLGQHAGERGLEALRLELDPTNSNTLGRRGAVYGLARAGARAELEDYLSRESDESVQAALEDALEGNTQSSVFEHLTA